MSIGIQWCNLFDWTYLYDADGFLLFRGFDSGSRAHFRSESFQRFIYSNKIENFVPVSGDCQCPLDLAV